MRQIQRRYAKRGSSSADATGISANNDGSGSARSGGGDVKGYASLKEACRDIDQLIDVVWVSGTRGCSYVPYG